MKGIRIVAIALILAGILGLAYGGFSYNKAHNAKIGPLELIVNDRRTFDIPIWVSLAAAATGVILLVVPRKS